LLLQIGIYHHLDLAEGIEAVAFQLSLLLELSGRLNVLGQRY